jgi:hypothetical protein
LAGLFRLSGSPYFRPGNAYINGEFLTFAGARRVSSGSAFLLGWLEHAICQPEA